MPRPTAIEQAGQLTLAEARDLLGTSRRFAQALLEHMDSEGLTLRVGDAIPAREGRSDGGSRTDRNQRLDLLFTQT